MYIFVSYNLHLEKFNTRIRVYVGTNSNNTYINKPSWLSRTIILVFTEENIIMVKPVSLQNLKRIIIIIITLDWEFDDSFTLLVVKKN